MNQDSMTITVEEAAKKVYDAVVVPGGGIVPETGAPHPWVCERLNAAAQLDCATRYHIVLSRGTTHRAPPVGPDGFPVDEAAASAMYLYAAGVADAGRILQDTWSLDTIGNAFFCRQSLAEPLGLTKLIIITSSFHMPRTRIIFDWVFGLPSPSGGTSVEFAIDYCVTKDAGMSAEEVASRVEKEQGSLARLVTKTMPRVTTMAALAKFLFVEHGAYNSTPRAPALTSVAKSTY
jgi:hypothetical protein